MPRMHNEEKKSVRTANRPRVRWGLQILSWICAGLSLVIFGIGIYGLDLARTPNTDPIWKAVQDIGPAVAGSWVLCAALLAVTAAGITAISNSNDADRRTAGEREAVRKVCVGEIKSFWDHANRLDLHAKLTEHIAWLKEAENDRELAKERAPFRRNFGEDWLRFAVTDPKSVGLLDQAVVERYVSLAAKVRNLTSRLNWLNTCQFDSERIIFWVDYHQDTLEGLNDLAEPSNTVMALVGDSETAMASFQYR